MTALEKSLGKTLWTLFLPLETSPLFWLFQDGSADRSVEFCFCVYTTLSSKKRKKVITTLLLLWCLQPRMSKGENFFDHHLCGMRKLLGLQYAIISRKRQRSSYAKKEKKMSSSKIQRSEKQIPVEFCLFDCQLSKETQYIMGHSQTTTLTNKGRWFVIASLTLTTSLELSTVPNPSQ